MKASMLELGQGGDSEGEEKAEHVQNKRQCSYTVLWAHFPGILLPYFCIPGQSYVLSFGRTLSCLPDSV